MAAAEPEELHPALEPLAALVGTWRGEGRGHYPTIASFTYGEEVTFAARGRPFLTYRQRTWLLPDNRPSHTEAGYWRCPEPGRVEVVLSHPFGVVEVQEGTVTGTAIALASTALAATSSAKAVTGIERRLLVDGDRLEYALSMAAVGLPMTAHLTAELRRVA